MGNNVAVVGLGRTPGICFRGGRIEDFLRLGEAVLEAPDHCTLTLHEFQSPVYGACISAPA